jgi:hypothetical protein
MRELAAAEKNPAGLSDPMCWRRLGKEAGPIAGECHSTRWNWEQLEGSVSSRRWMTCRGQCQGYFSAEPVQRELKYREIAEQLGLSVKTVEAQMSKALKTAAKVSWPIFLNKQSIAIWMIC